MKQFQKRRPIGPALELYKLLEALGWQNTKLAAEIGVTNNTVSRWINRKTSPPTLVLVMLRKLVKAKQRNEAKTAARRAARDAAMHENLRKARTGAIFIICPDCGKEVSHRLTCDECGFPLPLRKGLAA